MSPKIKTWKKFGRIVRSRGCGLLKRLDSFPNAILVTGCQRSGTTMLSRIITLSDGMVNYWFGKDDELDAALILSGFVSPPPRNGRYCFQTTYLNECMSEYYEHKKSYQLIWVLRNPSSVVHSMLHNWKNFALNELFVACALDRLDASSLKNYKRFGIWSVSRLKRACLSYCGKVSQLLELHSQLPSDQLAIIDYDVLVKKKEVILPELYQFLKMPYRSHYANMIHSKSLSKHNKLSKKEHTLVNSTCIDIYEKAKALVSIT